VPTLRVEEGHQLKSVPFAQLETYDCVVIVTDHSAIDYERLVKEAKLVFDTRNATRAVRGHARGTLLRL
jgi:UDP-N-acetyl-D-glucosamine dehydrogenase